jgi:hypothetical protein
MTTNNLLNKIDSLEKILEELKKDVIQQPASNNHLEVLQHLLNSPDWPSAVDPDLLCNENNELDKIERAEGIRDIFIDENFDNKTITRNCLNNAYAYLLQVVLYSTTL